MAIGLILGGMMGLGLWLIVEALPIISRREGNLALRLQRLSAQGRMALEAGARRKGPALFLSPELERRLARAWHGMTPSQFYGQKLASGLVMLAMFPLMNVIGIHPFGAWPVWMWLAGFWLGFAMPDWMV